MLKYDKLVEDIFELCKKIKMVCNRTAVVESTMTASSAAIARCDEKFDFLLKENLMRDSYSKNEHSNS